MTEVWRDVPEWQGFYQVSDQGGVRSVDRRWPVVNRFGNVEMRLHRGKALKPGQVKNGYEMVSFTRPGGVREYRYVHDLVTLTFLGPRPDGMEVCHRNGIRTDNRLANLRYDTRSRNALDRHVHGTMNQARGEKHYYARLTEDAVREIRASRGLTCSELARRFGVHHSTAKNVLARRTWKHV